VFSIFPLLHRDLGFTDAQLGAAGAAFTWSYSLAMPFSGRLADLLPRKHLILASLWLWSLATLATALSTGVGSLLCSRIAMGLSESLYVPAAVALIAQGHSDATRSRALSVHAVAQYLGITLGGWYGGWAGDHIGWRQGFAGLTAVGLIYSFVLLAGLPERPFNSVSTAANSAGESHVAELRKSKSFLALCAVFCVFCAMLWMLYAWLPAFLHERYDLGLAASGLIATVFLQVSSAAGVLLGGFLGDLLARRSPLGRFQLILLGLILSAPFGLLTFATHSMPVMRLSACGFGLFGGLLMANIFSGLYEISGARNYGLATGVLNTVGGMGAGAAILAAGFWKASFGIDGLMLCALGLSIVCAWLLYRALRASSTWKIVAAR